MSLLSPTLSDLGSRDVKSLDFANVLTSSPTAEHVPPDIKRLVCETCWRTVFSADSFHRAWIARPEPFHSESAGFTYTTPTWRQMQRQRCRHLIKFRYQCQWCKIVCKEIKNHCFQHIYNIEVDTLRLPPKHKRFKLRVRFIQEERSNVITLQLVVENVWDPTFQVHAAAGMPDHTHAFVRILTTPRRSGGQVHP